jgi:hypothetical protein
MSVQLPLLCGVILAERASRSPCKLSSASHRRGHYSSIFPCHPLNRKKKTTAGRNERSQRQTPSNNSRHRNKRRMQSAIYDPAAFRTAANMNDTPAETNGRGIIYRVTDGSYHVQWKLSVMAGHQSARIRWDRPQDNPMNPSSHKSFQFLPPSLLITSPAARCSAIQLHIPSAATRTNRLEHSATSESPTKGKNEAWLMRRKRQEGCSYQMAACWPRAHTSRNLHVTSHDTAEKRPVVKQTIQLPSPN